MKISVTQEHIEHGQLRECYHCPVALAMREAYGKPVKVWMEGYSLTGHAQDFRRFPAQVSRWLVEWDNRGDCTPFEFEVKG